MKELTEKDKRRFWSKVDIQGPDDCWPWMAGRDEDGYGNFKLHGKNERANRVSYRIIYGRDPGNKKVRHTCDNPCCCNPADLLLGTQRDNMKDRDRRGRQAKGVRVGSSKLTENQVISIFHDPRVPRIIGDEYGISPQNVGHIKNGNTWGWLTSKQLKAAA